MLFTQDTKSTHPMTKDALASVMANRDYFREQIQKLKKAPKKEQILNIVLANYPRNR